MLVLVFDAMYTEETEKSMKLGRDCEIIFTDKEETADSRIENWSMSTGMNGAVSMSLRPMARNRTRSWAPALTV